MEMKSIQNLVKGEPDWHEKINNNTNELAEQINNCEEQLDVLNTERGYLTTVRSDTDANIFLKNGKYTGKGINFPDDGYWNIEVTTHGSGYAFQIAEKIATSSGTRMQGTIKYRNQLTSTTWTDWQQIATTEKTEILFPFASGYSKKVEGDSAIIEKVNNFVRLEFNVKKVNGEHFINNDIIAVIPFGYRPKNTMWGCVCDFDNGKAIPIIVSGAVEPFNQKE